MPLFDPHDAKVSKPRSQRAQIGPYWYSNGRILMGLGWGLQLVGLSELTLSTQIRFAPYGHMGTWVSFGTSRTYFLDLRPVLDFG